MVWIEVGNLPGYKQPAWKRSAALAADGTVFAPATIAGDEQRVFLAASWEGVPVVTERGHIFVPTNWMGREYPETAEVCALIESKVWNAAANS